MNWLYVFVVPLLLNPSVGVNVDELPRRPNLVSSFLSKILDQLSTGDLQLSDADLGENGRLSNLVGRIDYVSKEIDGHKSFGFKLNTTLNGQITGEYILNLDIPELFPIFGKGNLLIAAEGIKLNILVEARYDLVEEKFNIDLPIFDVAVKKSKVKFENLMDDPHLTNFLNELLSNLIPDLVTMYNKQLLQLAKPLINYFGNGILLCIKNEPFNIEECIKNLRWETKTTNVIVLFSNLRDSVIKHINRN